MNNYLLIYDSYHALESKIKDIIPKAFTNVSRNIYDLEEQSLEEVLTDLDTYGLFSTKKIIIVKNINLLADDKNTTHLLKYLTNSSPDNFLILTAPKLNLTKKINKELKSKTNFIELKTDPIKLIKESLKDYKLEAGVITKISEYANNNTDIIQTECEKLKEYKSSSMTITKQDIEACALKHLGESNQLVFDLIKDIASNNRKQALLKYNNLIQYNIDDIALIGLLESQLRLMVQVNLLLEKKQSKKEISNILNQHPYRIEKTMELLSSSNMKDISKLIKNLSDLDYKIKSGQLDNNGALFVYIINM